MEKKLVITIGRQFGSGGKEIGEALAKALQIPFYDKDLLTIAAKDSGINENLFISADETYTSKLLHSMSIGTYSPAIAYNYDAMFNNDQLFAIQSNTIKKLAQLSSCVIVGRCSDYVLKDEADCLNLFIHANKEYRVKRIAQTNQINEKEALDVIIKTDKKRANYYNFYTDQKWGKIENYHLCIDSSKFTLEQIIQMISIIINNKKFK